MSGENSINSTPDIFLPIHVYVLCFMDSPRNSTSSEDENVCDCNECTLISSIGRTSTNLPERDVGSANDADEHKTSMLSQSNAVLPSVSKVVPKDDGSPNGKPKYKLREFVIQTEPVHFVAPHDPIKLIWEELATQQQRCCDLDSKTNQRILDERKSNEMTHVLIFERIRKLEDKHRELKSDIQFNGMPSDDERKKMKSEFEYAKQGLADMVGRYTNDVRALEEKTQRIINNQADKLCHVDEDVKVSKNRLNNVEVRLTEMVAATNAQGSTCIQVERDSSRHQKWLEGLEERLQKVEGRMEHFCSAILHTNLGGQDTLSLLRFMKARIDLLEANQSKTSTTTPPEEQQT